MTFSERTCPNLSSPSRSQEGGNEPSCRASSAEFKTVRPIPSREAGGLPHLECVSAKGRTDNCRTGRGQRGQPARELARDEASPPGEFGEWLGKPCGAALLMCGPIHS
jgi:hypothetical protein